MTVAGKESSIVAFEGRTKTEPDGSKSDADCAPLMICKRTGTEGDVKVAPLMKKFVPF